MEHGVLLVRGSHDKVVSWVRRGTLPAYVVPGGRWWGVVAAGPSEVGGPYSVGAPMLAGHPLAAGLRPGIGLFVHAGAAIVCVAPKGWRKATRWLAWTPGEGSSALPGLPMAHAQDIAQAAGLPQPSAVASLEALLADAGGDADALVDDLAVALELPFVETCHGTSGAELPDAELVAPAPVAVARFRKVVSEEKRLERELEEGL